MLRKNFSFSKIKKEDEKMEPKDIDFAAIKDAEKSSDEMRKQDEEMAKQFKEQAEEAKRQAEQNQ
jgi:hypothetical protein